MTPAQKRLWGIDSSRYIAWEVREPAQIFDRLEKEVPRLCQAGIKLRLVIIDSVNDILGRKMMNAETVDQHLVAVGDILTDCRGRQTHAVLARFDLLGHADTHGLFSI